MAYSQKVFRYTGSLGVAQGYGEIGLRPKRQAPYLYINDRFVTCLFLQRQTRFNRLLVEATFSELCEQVVKTIFDRSIRDRLQTCPTFIATLGLTLASYVGGDTPAGINPGASNWTALLSSWLADLYGCTRVVCVRHHVSLSPWGDDHNQAPCYVLNRPKKTC